MSELFVDVIGCLVLDHCTVVHTTVVRHSFWQSMSPSQNVNKHMNMVNTYPPDTYKQSTTISQVMREAHWQCASV